MWVFISTTFLRHVDAGYTGVLISYGIGNQPTAEDVPSNTYRWINPFAGQVFIEYPSSQQTLAMVANSTEGDFPGDDSIPCQDKSGIAIKGRDMRLNWQVTDASKLYLLRKIGTLTGDPNHDVESLVVRQAVISDAQVVCSQYAWNDMAATTSQFGQQVEALLRPQLLAEGISVNGVYPGVVYYTPQQEQALNDLATAQQKAQQSQYLLQVAQNQAAAEIAKAQGDAQAISIVNKQLASTSSAYIAWLEAQKWDGHLPSVLSSNGNTNPIQAVLPPAK